MNSSQSANPNPPPGDDAFDELLKESLAVPDESKEKVMSELSIALSAEASRAPRPRSRKQSPPADTFWSKLLAAGIFLVLGVGLFLMVRRPSDDPAKQPGAALIDKNSQPGDPKDEKKDPAPVATTSGLSDDEKKHVDALIKQMDSDDFAMRADAQQKLFVMGEKIVPYLNGFLAGKTKLSPEVNISLPKVVDEIVRTARTQRIEKDLAQLEKAIAEAPAHYFPPSAEVKAKLAKKVTFEFVDVPLNDAAAWLEKNLNIPFIIDPVLKGTDIPAINLRVTDMAGDLALDWVLRLADLFYVIRKDYVLLTTHDRAAKLCLLAYEIVLPTREGEAPWTFAETELMADILKIEPVAFYKQYENDYGWHQPEPALVKAVAPGKLLVHDDRDARTHYSHFLEIFKTGVIDIDLYLSPPTEKLKQALQKEITLAFGKDATLPDTLSFLNTMTKLTIVLDPNANLNATGKLRKDIIFDKKPMSEVLTTICDSFNLAYDLRNNAIFITDREKVKKNAKLACVAFDLAPALKAGLNEGQLLQSFYQITKLREEPPVLRGRWIGHIAPEQIPAAIKMLDTAAKTGKIPNTP
jgi:hypothetical protein